MARHAYLVNPPLYYAQPASFPRKDRRQSTDDALHSEDSAEMSLFSTVLLVVALVVGGAFFIMSMAYVLSYEHHYNAGESRYSFPHLSLTHAMFPQPCPRRLTAPTRCYSGQ